MSKRRTRLPLRALALLLLAALLAACGGIDQSLKGSANVPSSFDVTVLSDKDHLFDFQDAPLTEQDLTSALRYRKDENQPTATVLMKRGDGKITKQHVIGLARIAYNLGIRAFVEDDGVISEIRAQLKGGDKQDD
jgi:hypothetical protein